MREYNFDGLVGPTHNYAGLSFGNVASALHGGQVSNPRAAALQGLEKMRFVYELGVGQAVLPPQPRPSLRVLRALGFTGSDEQVITRAAQEAPEWLRLCSSASAMWTANAATVAPACDAADGRMHLTPANLQAMFHRAIEADTTHAVLRAIFADPARFVVHAPLPGGGQLGDEGAANHTRLASERGPVHLFAWGRSYQQQVTSQRYPARQTLEASRAVARLHGLAPERCVFAQQAPAGIDAGAFHTDVLAVGSGALLLLHEHAFVAASELLGQLGALLGDGFRSVLASDAELPIAAAVKAYPFNSQLLQLPDASMVIVAPSECEENPAAKRFLDRVVAEDNPVKAIHYRDVRQSMRNGGGPACLRLRVPLTAAERSAVQANVFYDEGLHTQLAAWINKHYRDQLAADDLRDPQLARESMTALDELTQLLHIGAVYDFQSVTSASRT
ncbi:MAG: N-succinylarginine dihydrolase [Polyangiales bacterium]